MLKQPQNNAVPALTEEDIEKLEMDLGGPIIESVRSRLKTVRKLPPITAKLTFVDIMAENIKLRKRCNDLQGSFLKFSLKTVKRNFRRG